MTHWTKPKAVARIERGLPGNTVHLLAEDARLLDAVISVIGGNKLLAWRRHRSFLDHRQMWQLGFAAQAAIRGILSLLDFGGHVAAGVSGGSEDHSSGAAGSKSRPNFGGGNTRSLNRLSSK